MTPHAGQLTIIGLGPGDPDVRTIGAQRALDEADAIILRTRIHPGLDDLAADRRVTDCDDLYERAMDFAALYEAIADRVLSRAREGGNVVYAVPGHPRFAEQSVALIERRAGEIGTSVVVLDAVSFVDSAVTAMGADPVADGLQIVDAEHIAASLESDPYAAGLLGVDPDSPLLVAQLYDEKRATAVKLALSRVYPDEHPILVLHDLGIPKKCTIAPIRLHELDRQPVSHLTSLWVLPLQHLEATRSPETLARIVARLRAPGGCPWDREQTHASMRNAILEEAYETVDAIDRNDAAGLAEELGDLLLLVMMHAQMAEEEGAFSVEDVYDEINRKLIRRHPHVFGSVHAETPDAVVATWEGVKKAERAAKGDQEENGRVGRLPRSMPATRKVIELLAPRSALRPPASADDGNAVLEAVEGLIEAGIDPELALEASLRHRFQTTSVAATPTLTTDTGKERG